jgi:hypothetical protein
MTNIAQQTYNVHIYREMRLRFDNIKADSHEAASAIARSLSLKVADDFDECEGRTFTALVDVVGDDEYADSETIDFEDGKLLDAAPKMLTAARMVIDNWENGDLAHAVRTLSEAVAEAEGK